MLFLAVSIFTTGCENWGNENGENEKAGNRVSVIHIFKNLCNNKYATFLYPVASLKVIDETMRKHDLKHISGFLCLIILIFSSSTYAQNNSLHFDGVDDKVEIQGTQSPFNLSTFTIEAWINADAWKAQQWQGTIVSKDGNNQSGYVLRCGNNGRLSFTVGAGSGWPEIVSNPIMQTNVWHHVAAVYDNGDMKIYIDGVLEASSTGNTIVNSNVNLLIGESAGFAGRVFDGRIDEVRIWNVARTQSEIASNDTTNLDPNTAGLLAYYKFDQTSGTVLPNLTPTANLDGTLINFAVFNAWVSGFEPTITDISVESIVSPSFIHAFDRAFKIKVNVKNNGIDTISGFDLAYVLNGQSAVSETFTEVLMPGESKDITFSDPVDQNTSAADIQVYSTVSGDLNALNDTIAVDYSASSNPNRVVVFNNKQHNFGTAGQSHVASVALPENNAKYEQILMRIRLNCPGTGCDPWDQPAKISLLKDGQLYELARFITPYGKACGPWTIDVTDFKGLLTGNCDFVSYIQVWGGSGWLLNVNLDFIEGNTPNPYKRLDYLWASDNWVYGEPTVSYDLPARTIPIDNNTQGVDLRMTISGHGQGNTTNAAEFSNFTHTVHVDGFPWSAHTLWKDDCDQNSCSNQFGTWLFARAGWCPGQGVYPHVVDLDNAFTGGQDLEVDYVLQTYTNFLNSGYNGSSHTEPHYKIHAYLVQSSDQYIDTVDWANLEVLGINSPSALIHSSNTPVKVLLRNNGSEAITDPSFYRNINGTVVQETYFGTIQPGDSLEYEFADIPGFVQGNPYDIMIAVNHPEDESASDDFAFLELNITSEIENKSFDQSISVYPNPNDGRFKVSSTFGAMKSIQVYSIQGKMLENIEFTENTIETDLNLPRGSYLLKIFGDEELFIRKVIIN